MAPSDGVVGKGGFLRRHSELVGIAVRFMDLTIIVLGALIAHYIRFDVFPLGLEYKIALLIVLFGDAVLFPLLDLYISSSAWEQIRNAKERSIKLINKNLQELNPNDNAIKLSQAIFEDLITLEKSPTQEAIEFLKEEIRTLY